MKCFDCGIELTEKQKKHNVVRGTVNNLYLCDECYEKTIKSMRDDFRAITGGSYG